jgi:hypothetical protein
MKRRRGLKKEQLGLTPGGPSNLCRMRPFILYLSKHEYPNGMNEAEGSPWNLFCFSIVVVIGKTEYKSLVIEEKDKE